MTLTPITTTFSTGYMPGGSCRWCTYYHPGKCPLVSAIEYFSDGVTVKRVEFYPPAGSDINSTSINVGIEPCPPER